MSFGESCIPRDECIDYVHPIEMPVLPFYTGTCDMRNLEFDAFYLHALFRRRFLREVIQNIAIPNLLDQSGAEDRSWNSEDYVRLVRSKIRLLQFAGLRAFHTGNGE